MNSFINEIIDRLKKLEDNKLVVEKRLDELERNVVSHNGARLIMNDDLRVEGSTILKGGTYGDNS